MNTYATNLRGALDAAIRETGAMLHKSSADVAVYAAQRAAHLATIVGQAGFDEAVVAERDAVILFAGLSAVRNADAADERIVGLIHGALAIGLAGGA
jgi:hypothetical protein